MKKRILSTLFALGYALNVAAGPRELSDKLLEGRRPIYGGRSGTGLYIGGVKSKSTEGYNIETSSIRVINVHGEEIDSNLMLTLSDDKTTISMLDNSLNGQGQGDRFSLSNKFKNGDYINLRIWQTRNDNYDVQVAITSEEGGPLAYRVDTEDLNPIMRFLVRRKTRPAILWGDSIYREMVSAAENEQEPNVPYAEIKAALRDVEKLLPEIRGEKRGVESALLKLADRHSKRIGI